MKHLSRNEMKKVMGGYPPNWGTCTAKCGNGAIINACSCEAASSFCGFGGGGLESCSCQGNPTCD